MPQQTDQDLVDLPDQQQKRIKIFDICSPKIIILIILSTFFVCSNIYNYMQKPPTTPKPQIQQDYFNDFWKTYQHVKEYILVTIIAFVVLVMLMRSNDQYQMEKMEKKRKEEEEKEEAASVRQREREERIIRKLEEEERQAARKQQMTTSDKTQ